MRWGFWEKGRSSPAERDAPIFLRENEELSVGRGGLRCVKGHAKSEDERRIEINVNDSVLRLDDEGTIEKLVDNLSEGQFL